MATWFCCSLALMDGVTSFYSKTAKTWNLYFDVQYDNQNFHEFRFGLHTLHTWLLHFVFHACSKSRQGSAI